MVNDIRFVCPGASIIRNTRHVLASPWYIFVESASYSQPFRQIEFVVEFSIYCILSFSIGFLLSLFSWGRGRGGFYLALCPSMSRWNDLDGACYSGWLSRYSFRNIGHISSLQTWNSIDPTFDPSPLVTFGDLIRSFVY